MKYRFVCVKLIIVMILLLNTIINAAIVSDNDGAAFVTKAEFEALKMNFAEQITSYNDSIDNKIDGAIASYLAGRVGQKKSSPGLLNKIKNISAADAVFRYGGDIGTTTTDPFSTDMVNPNISILGMYSQGSSSYSMIQYYSHDPESYGYSGRFEEPDAGCYLVGFVEQEIDGNKYYSFGDDFYVRKWQFKLLVQGFQEYSSQTLSTVGYASATWDFKTTIPQGWGWTFTNCGKNIPCAKSCVNMYIDSEINNRSKSGAYYTESSNTNVYGWLKSKYYIYDTSISKTEAGKRACWRRYVKNGSNSNDKPTYNYVFNMPKKYVVQFDKLVNYGATSVLGKPVYCYNGLPFLTTEKGTFKVEWKMKVQNAGTENTGKYKLYVAEEPFDNTTVTSTTLDSKKILFKDDDWQDINTSRKIEFELNETKEQTLYFKVEPQTSNTNVALVAVDEDIIIYME